MHSLDHKISSSNIKKEVVVRYYNMNRQAILIRGAFLALQVKNMYNKKWIQHDILIQLLEELQLLPSSHIPPKNRITRTITRAFESIDDIYNTTSIIRMYTQ